MSAFLAPIHQWLFNKIQKVNDRTELILEEARARYGDNAEEAQALAWESFGAPLASETSLADVIDHANIHGWLSRQVNGAECREAAVIAELVRLQGSKAYEWIGEIFEQTGRQSGKRARVEIGDDASPQKLYKALQNDLLNGMPCDDIDEIIQSDKKGLSWLQKMIPQRKAWRRTDADEVELDILYQKWLIGFFSGLAPEYSFKVESAGEGREFLLEVKVK